MSKWYLYKIVLSGGADIDGQLSESKFKGLRGKSAIRNINVQSFLSKKLPIDEMLKTIKKYILFDLFEKYENLRFRNKEDLIEVLNDIFNKTKRPFIFLIDEWDCMFREYTHNTEAQKLYLDFLRALLKDQEYVAFAYMTGILPIKKYGTHSALNMFTEYSMTNSRDLAEFFGFTEDEVKILCAEYGMSFDEAQ